jgi:DNA repair exonuclease SbcCD ATPase subunit
MNEIQNVDTLTTEILILKQQTAQNIIEIGKRLIAVKESLPHGAWGQWLHNKVDFSQPTANRFMRAAEAFSNYSALNNLTQTKIFALLDLPQEERDEFIQDNPVEEMTTRELQQAIKEKKEIEDKLKKLTKANEKEKARAEKLKKELEEIDNKNIEALTNKEVEIENLKIYITDAKRQLSEAQAAGDDKRIEHLEQSLQGAAAELDEAKEKIEELEEKLKEKPIDVTETIIEKEIIVEKIPEEVEKELQELREKASLNNSPDKAIIKFSVCFDGLVKQFKEVLAGLEEIKGADTSVHEKYKNAVAGLISKMAERL